MPNRNRCEHANFVIGHFVRNQNLMDISSGRLVQVKIALIWNLWYVHFNEKHLETFLLKPKNSQSYEQLCWYKLQTFLLVGHFGRNQNSGLKISVTIVIHQLFTTSFQQFMCIILQWHLTHTSSVLIRILMGTYMSHFNKKFTTQYTVGFSVFLFYKNLQQNNGYEIFRWHQPICGKNDSKLACKII